MPQCGHAERYVFLPKTAASEPCVARRTACGDPNAAADRTLNAGRKRIGSRRRFYVCQAARAGSGVSGVLAARVRKIWRAM